MLVFQTDLEEKLAKLEEMMAQHPAGCGAVPFAAATPAEMARAARMDEKQREKKRLAAQLQAIEDKTEALQVCLVPCGVFASLGMCHACARDSGMSSPHS